MQMAIVGSGAVGSVLAGHLLRGSGASLSLLARGGHMRAIREKGLVLRTGDETWTGHPRVSDDPQALGPMDVILLTVKAHQLPALAPTLPAMIGPKTLVVSIQNGLPWWYYFGSPCGAPDGPFQIVDPGAVIWNAIGPHRAIGGVISVGADIVEPGVARHRGGPPDLTMGPPKAGAHAGPLADLAGRMGAVGIAASVTDSIREPLWKKQQIAVAFGPAGVLTDAPLEPLQYFPGMAGLLSAAMHECLAVARAAAVVLPDDIEARLSQPLGPPEHRPSMQQDFRAGKALELDATLTAVIEIAARHEVPVPTLATLLPLVSLRVAQIRRQAPAGAPAAMDAPST